MEAEYNTLKKDERDNDLNYDSLNQPTYLNVPVPPPMQQVSMFHQQQMALLPWHAGGTMYQPTGG
ncbi:hypothetical protein SNEBB_009213, partial [Seison nebaliae]